MTGWFDNHCHLTTLKGGITPQEAVDAAQQAGVVGFMTVGCDVADSEAAIAIAAQFDNVWATAGVHPHEASAGIEGLEGLVDQVAAVGECGLDYYYNHSPRNDQIAAFEAQIDLAKRTDKALVIHSRDAWVDTFSVLDSVGMPPRTVFHCFTGGPDEAEKCLERGATLSFSGIVTFPTASDLRQAAVITPADQLVVETDSPYLAPVPFRGKSNQPAHVTTVGEFVAEVRGVDPGELAAVTTVNVARLYQIDLPSIDTASA